jgi:hypothetical protein
MAFHAFDQVLASWILEEAEQVSLLFRFSFYECSERRYFTIIFET